MCWQFYPSPLNNRQHNNLLHSLPISTLESRNACFIFLFLSDKVTLEKRMHVFVYIVRYDCLTSAEISLCPQILFNFPKHYMWTDGRTRQAYMEKTTGALLQLTFRRLHETFYCQILNEKINRRIVINCKTCSIFRPVTDTTDTLRAM